MMTNEDHKYDEILNLLHRRNEAAACLAEQVQNEYKDSYRTQQAFEPSSQKSYVYASLAL